MPTNEEKALAFALNIALESVGTRYAMIKMGDDNVLRVEEPGGQSSKILDELCAPRIDNFNTNYNNELLKLEGVGDNSQVPMDVSSDDTANKTAGSGSSQIPQDRSQSTSGAGDIDMLDYVIRGNKVNDGVKVFVGTANNLETDVLVRNHILACMNTAEKNLSTRIHAMKSKQTSKKLLTAQLYNLQSAINEFERTKHKRGLARRKAANDFDINKLIGVLNKYQVKLVRKKLEEQTAASAGLTQDVLVRRITKQVNGNVDKKDIPEAVNHFYGEDLMERDCEQLIKTIKDNYNRTALTKSLDLTTLNALEKNKKAMNIVYKEDVLDILTTICRDLEPRGNCFDEGQYYSNLWNRKHQKRLQEKLKRFIKEIKKSKKDTIEVITLKGMANTYGFEVEFNGELSALVRQGNNQSNEDGDGDTSVWNTPHPEQNDLGMTNPTVPEYSGDDDENPGEDILDEALLQNGDPNNVPPSYISSDGSSGTFNDSYFNYFKRGKTFNSDS